MKNQQFHIINLVKSYFKTLSVLVILILNSTNSICQTGAIEKANIARKFESGEIDVMQYRAIVEKWRNLLSSFGGYPELPYNGITKMIEFSFVKEYPSIDKKTIYNRIIEWSVINFGSLNTVLYYENFETGKIIIKGSIDIKYMAEFSNFWGIEMELIEPCECSETIVLTVKDNKVKIEILNLSYEFTTGGCCITGSYVPTTKTYRSIHSLYPVTEGPSTTWKVKLSLLVETADNINLLIALLDLYIKNHVEDYNF